METDTFIREHSGWPGVLLMLLAPVIAALAFSPADAWEVLTDLWHVAVIGSTVGLAYRAGTARWGTGAVIGLTLLGPPYSFTVMLAAYATGSLPDGWGAGAEVLPYAIWIVVCVTGGLLVAHARQVRRL